jgi:hypothetical protein
MNPKDMEEKKMAEDDGRSQKIAFADVIIEALKGIRNEILIYAVAMAALLVASAYLGIEILRELKWPLLLIFSAALVAYFIARAVPQARARLKRRASEENQ